MYNSPITKYKWGLQMKEWKTAKLMNLRTNERVKSWDVAMQRLMGIFVTVEIQQGCVEELKGWCDEKFIRPTLIHYSLKGWKVERLRGWKVERLKGWKVEAFMRWMQRILFVTLHLIIFYLYLKKVYRYKQYIISIRKLLTWQCRWHCHQYSPWFP